MTSAEILAILLGAVWAGMMMEIARIRRKNQKGEDK